MMNMENTENADSNEGVDMAALQLMQQAMMMQMQLMQTMCMMPLQLMQSFLETLESAAPELFRSEAGESEEQKGGFQLGSLEIPPWLLAKLMQLDMSPENLAKLQRVLDFVFEAMPQPKDE